MYPISLRTTMLSSLLQTISPSPRFRVVALAGVTVAVFFGLTACDSSGGNAENTSSLEISFQTAESSSTSSTSVLAKNEHPVEISGSNGTLRLEEIRFIVENFELDVADGEDSLDVEAPPSFLNLPLNSTDFASAGSFEIPPETYDEFEFEVDDLEADEDDSQEEQQQIEDLFNEIQNIETFSNWPREASMVAIGTFTPTDGEAQPFQTYMETEIEVERELSPPLEVTEDGLSRSLTVKMDPSLWFSRPDSDEVINLHTWQQNWENEEEMLEIENEFEEGVMSIEIDDD